MLASPNYARMIYDGDGNDAALDPIPGTEHPAGPEGSGKVESV